MHFRPLIVGVHSLGRCPLNAGVLLEAGSCLSISSVPNPCWLKISSGVPNICNIILESIIIHCANPYQPTTVYIYIYILYKGIGEGFERCSCEFLYVSLQILQWPASSSLLTKYAAKQRPKRMSQASGKPRYAATPLGASRTRQRSVWSEVSHLIYESLFSAEGLQRRVRAYRVSWSLASHYL